METENRPGPVPDEDSRPYWDAMRAHRILLHTCTRCGEVRCPPMPSCPNCGGTGANASYAAGRGVVYSWIEVHRPVGNVLAGEVPCTIATVELDEGPRVVARLDESKPSIGRPVTASFVDHDTWTELAFAPAGAAR